MRTAKPKPEAAPIQRANQSTTGPEFELPLDSLKQNPEDYQHRNQEDLEAKKAAMKALMDSLQSEGLQEPLIVYKDPSTGAYVQITGHRRRAALEQLADEHVGNFKRDMPVKVREVLDGGRHDYLLFSVMDNVIREQLDEYQKICAAIKFIGEGIDHPRIRYSLNLSESSFDRIKRLAANPWMFEHVKREEIGLTDAHQLLESAGGKGGAGAIADLKKDLAREIATAGVSIAKLKQDLAERDKAIKPADEVVKNYFPPHTIKSWVQALKRGDRIPKKVKFHYDAALEKDKSGKRLVVPAITIRIVDSELERLAEVVMKLDRLVKDARPEVNALARQRKALDSREDDGGPADFASAGLDEVEALFQPTHPDVTPDKSPPEVLASRMQADDTTQAIAAREVIQAQSRIVVQPTQPADNGS